MQQSRTNTEKPKKLEGKINKELQWKTEATKKLIIIFWCHNMESHCPFFSPSWVQLSLE